MTRFEAASHDYLPRGWTPIPIPAKAKNPGFKGWQKYQPNGHLEHDFRGDGNVGLLLGKPSSGLTDIDLDWVEAVRLASRFLPATEMKSGRGGSPLSHWWFIADGVKTEQWVDPNKPEGDERAMIVELRGTGAQTVVAPSVHPSGDSYIWQGALNPAKVEAALLRKATARLAACALITRYWPNGARHGAALPLAGVLFRNGWTRADVDNFILSAAQAAGDEELDDRAAAIRDTENKFRNGAPITGLPTLAEIFGAKTVEKFAKWLELRSVTYEQTPGKGTTNTEAGAATQAEDAAKWAEPQPIPDGLLPVPQLPVALIPAAFRGWLHDIATRLQVPLDFPTVPAIVAAASVIGNQARIRPKKHDDWEVIPNTWGGVAGRPGVLKSPAIKAALGPLYELAAEAKAKYDQAVKDWEFDKEVAEAKKQNAKEKIKKAVKEDKPTEGYRSEMQSADESEPTWRRYVVNDSTVEKYGELLNENPNGLLILRDELSGWFHAMDDERNQQARKFYLEAWDGDKPYTWDRIGRGSLHIENTTTSILGGIQPGPLEAYLRGALGGGEGDDGLLQRFQLWTYPDLPAEWTYIDRWPDSEARKTAFEVFKALAEIPKTIPFETETDKDGKPVGKPWARFDEEAQEFFVEWYSELSRELYAGKFEHPALESHFSKYRSLMPSLALTFELINAAAKSFEGFEGKVSIESARMAAAWCTFLMAHAQRIYNLGISGAAIGARTLAKHIIDGDVKASDPDGFTARDIHFKGWAGLSTVELVAGPLDMLEHLGWIRGSQITRGGRPKVVYTVNPQVREVKL
jgi:putative DNA primase/helicase